MPGIHGYTTTGMALRVVHIDAGRDWRGGQRQVFLLTQALRAAGAEPLVIGTDGSRLVARLRDDGLAASAVPMRGDWDIVAARRVRSIARAWRADVVHAHDARAHAIALAALALPRLPRAAPRPRVPLVVTRRMARPLRYARLKYSNRVARFIAISGAVRDAMITSGVAPDRIDVVYSGVPTPIVTNPRDWRAECGWPADAVLCGVVGAMTAEKGVAELATIAERLPVEARMRAKLVLLGGTAPAGHTSVGGIEAFRAGFVDDVHPAVAGLDLLWHPARSEGLGTAVIDAMALRVPPVAFAAGGLSELIESGRSGMLIPPGDLSGFAAAVARLIGDAEYRHTLANAGPARAAMFSVDRMVEGTARVYDTVLGNPG